MVGRFWNEQINSLLRPLASPRSVASSPSKYWAHSSQLRAHMHSARWTEAGSCVWAHSAKPGECGLMTLVGPDGLGSGRAFFTKLPGSWW